MEPRPTTDRLLLFAGIALLVALTIWFTTHAFVSPASRECLALYRLARTAADTTRIDTTLPLHRDAANPEAKSCGFIRSKARW